MPNWCYNDLTISHKDPEMIRRLAKAGEEGNTLQEFYPCPQALLDTRAGSYGDDEKQAMLLVQEGVNLAQYGHKNWYDWKVSNWGTKWDVTLDNIHLSHGDTVLSATFDSAWSPPVEAYAKLAELGFEIEAKYHEPGMAFAGEWTNNTGEYTVNFDFSDENWRENMSDELASFLEADYENWLMWQKEEEVQNG